MELYNFWRPRCTLRNQTTCQVEEGDYELQGLRLMQMTLVEIHSFHLYVLYFVFDLFALD